MSRITWQVEQRTHDDPWTQQQETYTVRTGWACRCGTTSPRRLRKGMTLEQLAVWHLEGHGAPRAESDGHCVCEWVYVPVAHERAGDIQRRHEQHHAEWLLGVWDA